MGFRAYKGSTEGFVTCAHSFRYQTGTVNVANPNDTVIGNSYANERQFGGKLDAAFIHKAAGNTFANTIYGS